MAAQATNAEKLAILAIGVVGFVVLVDILEKRAMAATPPKAGPKPAPTPAPSPSTPAPKPAPYVYPTLVVSTPGEPLIVYSQPDLTSPPVGQIDNGTSVKVTALGSAGFRQILDPQDENLVFGWAETSKLQAPVDPGKFT